ncbi:TonB-dependent receptor [Paraglaciecola chathamensis]|uniref:TonB-dependent receptor plug domain-containing protein n=1 Tax=Paraglaciecola chathamensis TaxID=368405 RepID=UPI002708CA2B|nr:TonB-dependent receptor [Paraglaciecola chathamensis]MDO6841903.1 TonB-dependent receptor [Paraglaciecola chathamensis]
MSLNNRILYGMLTCGASMCAAFTAPFAYGQTSKVQTNYSQLEKIVVTASRDAQPISDIQASVQVFDQALIASFSGASITEVLRQAVGVDARSSGSNSVIAVRGQIPNAGSAVLILIDGLPRTGKFGQVELNNYPVEDVERIEVIRGPMSSLYGANAAGGVINVITKKPGDGSLLSLNLLAGGTDSSEGSGRETYRINGSINFKAGETGHRVSIDYRDAEPFNFNDSHGEDDLLGIEHLSVRYNGYFRQSDSSEFTWTLEHYKQDDRGASTLTTNEVIQRYEKETREYGSLRWEGDVANGRLVLEGAIGNSNAAVNRSFPAPDELTDFTQQLYQGQYYFDIGQHSLLVSAGTQIDEVDVSILTQVGENTNTFAFIQDQWGLSENVRLVMGLRYDRFDAFGSKTTPRITIGTRTDGLTWRVGYGEAFRAPSVLEQFASFNRGRFLIIGAPDIAPESSNTYEAATGWRGQRGFIELVYHESKIDNLIQASLNGDVVNGLLVFEYQNIAQAKISGVEVSGQYHLGHGFSFTGSYEHLNADDKATNQKLVGRAEDSVRVSIHYENRGFKATLRSRHTLDLYGTDPSDRARPPFKTNYSVVDLSLRYAINKHLGLSFGVDNLFDKQVPLNWSSTGSIEDPAGRFAYLALNLKID